MKILAIAAAVAGLAFSSPLAIAATSAMPGQVCLEAYLIDHTHVVDSSTVRFYLRGGKVWQNNLSVPCDGLKLHGFTVIGHESEICAKSGISVIETHQVCQLGAFVPYASSASR